MSRLGDYQMVMALSEFTINHLFIRLKLHPVWSIRMTYIKGTLIDPVVFDEGIADQNRSYGDVKPIFDGAFANVPGNEDRKGFIAEIRNPFISIREKEHFNVSFSIPFAKGELAWTEYDRDAGVNIAENCSLAGLTYVFTVELSKISHPYPQATFIDPVAQENVKAYVEAQLDNTKLEAKDFTIETLFLNFENANFIADSAATIYPDGADPMDQRWGEFQNELQRYFKQRLAGSANPWVLGYGVTVPDLEKRADAVFQPASLNLSTSFAQAVDENGHLQTNPKGSAKADPRKCSLNYLMMITKASTADPDAGTIARSLIDEYDVLGIDYSLFFDRYLKPAFDIISNQLNATLQALNNSDASGQTGFLLVNVQEGRTISYDGTFALRCAPDLRSVDFGSATVHASASRTTTSPPGPLGGPGTKTHVEWRKTIHAHPSARIMFPRLTTSDGSVRDCLRVDLRLAETTDYYYEYDKAGSATTSRDGAGLYLDAYPAPDGQMSVTISQYDDHQTTLTKGKQETVNKVDSVISGDFFSRLKLPGFLSALTGKLQTGLNTLPKVVLPISNVYKYKAIRFMDSEQLSDRVITFQSTYSPTPAPAPLRPLP
jgi:hypothetical protein